MIYGYFALLILAQVVGLIGLRRRGHEVGFSAAAAGLVALAIACAGIAAQSFA